MFKVIEEAVLHMPQVKLIEAPVMKVDQQRVASVTHRNVHIDLGRFHLYLQSVAVNILLICGLILARA